VQDRPGGGTELSDPEAEGHLVATVEDAGAAPAALRAKPSAYAARTTSKFVSKQACVVSGREPSDAHHLRFAPPRAAVTVPVGRLHYRELHRQGDEAA
jgi:hypothetical protein